MVIILFIFQQRSSKKKRAGKIPTQRTAPSRRRYYRRGSGIAVQGRPRNENMMKMQMNVQDDEGMEGGVLTFKLPTKKRKRGGPHDLMTRVKTLKK